MTIQLASPEVGKSKATLLAALTADPSAVFFLDPFPWQFRRFAASTVKPGDHFPIVMDPATRRRFATVERRKDGTWKVL